MAESQTTNVIDAGNIIKGLMTKEIPTEKTEKEPSEKTEENITVEPTENTEAENTEVLDESETVNEINDLSDGLLDVEQNEDQKSESADVQESSEQPNYSVTINGTEQEVSLDELIHGYQRNADYTRKTQELSLEKNQHNDFVQRSKKEAETKLQGLNQLTQSAQQQLQQEYAQIDFEKLYEEDPVEAARLEHKMRRKNEKLAVINKQTADLQREEFEKYLQDQDKQLKLKMPDFSDPVKGPRFKEKIRSYLTEMGFNNQEIDSVYDHRYVMLVKDAMSYRLLQKAKPSLKQKAANVPKVIKSGVAKSKQQQSNETKNQLLSALRKTGNVKDAAKVFRSII